MTTPQNTPAGKHAAQAPQTSQQGPPAGQGDGNGGAPLVRLVNAGKRYGAVIALSDITMEVGAGEVTCVLGDNGAGKSTLIKIIAGLHRPSSGSYEVDGVEVAFDSPRQALEHGIATVYQDLAVVPLMPVWRNFFLGNEVRKGLRMDIGFMKKTCKDELMAMGTLGLSTAGRRRSASGQYAGRGRHRGARHRYASVRVRSAAPGKLARPATDRRVGKECRP